MARKTVGRTICYIAKKADEVVRVVCRVGNRLNEDNTYTIRGMTEGNLKEDILEQRTKI